MRREFNLIWKYYLNLDNSAAYINGWLSKLRNDRKLVVVAAAQAEKAVQLIRSEK